MARCDLTIHLEDERETYRPGETVRGTVEVACDGEVHCAGLTAELRWRTHGRGSSAHGERRSQILFEGDWRAGQHTRYPFAFELPAGPFTYHGHYLNVAWEVRTRADVPWALDPKDSREIALEPHAEEEGEAGVEPDWGAAVATPSLLPGELQEEIEARTPGSPTDEDAATAVGASSGGTKWLGNALGIGCLLAFALPLLGLLVAAVYHVLAFARGEIPLEQGLGWIVGGVVAFLLLFGGAFKLLRKLLARKKLGEVVYEVEPRLVRAGEPVRVKVFCQLQAETELLAAVAKIRAQERVVRGSGTNKTTYRKVVYEQEAEIALARKLGRGLPFQAEGTLTLPEDAPPSFEARRNRLRWTVTLRLDIARWPDWTEERVILVHP